MKTIEQIRNDYLNAHDYKVDDLTFLDAGEMLEEWLEFNPPSENIDLSCFTQAVNFAMYLLEKDRAVTYFNGEDYPLNIKAYRWNIEQAILNRDSGTMMAAAVDYITNLTANLP